MSKQIDNKDTSSDARGAFYEEHVKSLLEMLGYHAERDVLLGGDQTDLIATKQEGPFRLVFVVETKDHANPIGVTEIRLLKVRLDAARRKYPDAHGMFISSHGFTKEAKATANNLGLNCCTDEELRRGLIDFTSYLNVLIQEFEEKEIDSKQNLTLKNLYITPNVISDITGKSTSSNLALKHWLTKESITHFILLGDYGTGKTTFSMKIAAESAKEYLMNPESKRIPIRVDLKGYSFETNLVSYVITHIVSQGAKLSSPSAFDYFLASGRILLILDGFDEMSSQTNEDVTRKNFSEIEKLGIGRPKAKILITCRTHYFRDQENIELLAQGKKGNPLSATSQGTALYKEIVGKPEYVIWHLEKFDLHKIITYVKRVSGPKWREDLDTIRNTYDLLELASRPVLLDMIMKSLPKLTGEKNITAAGLYEAYTSLWLDRDDWRTVLTRKGKELLVLELAKHLWTNNSTFMHWKDLPDFIGTHAKREVSSLQKLEYADSEIRTASFLVRNENGYYGFAHRSFLEFFCAKYITQNLNSNKEFSLKTFGLTPSIIEFLAGLLDEKTDELIHVLQRTKNKTFNEVGYIGGNTLTMLNLMNCDLSKLDFDSLVLVEANFSCLNISGKSFRNSDLSNSSFNASYISNCDFRGANLTGIISQLAFPNQIEDIRDTRTILVNWSWSGFRKYRNRPYTASSLRRRI